jgi:hypothetical protein
LNSSPFGCPLEGLITLIQGPSVIKRISIHTWGHMIRSNSGWQVWCPWSRSRSIKGMWVLCQVYCFWERLSL